MIPDVHNVSHLGDEFISIRRVGAGRYWLLGKRRLRDAEWGEPTGVGVVPDDVLEIALAVLDARRVNRERAAAAEGVARVRKAQRKAQRAARRKNR